MTTLSTGTFDSTLFTSLQINLVPVLIAGVIVTPRRVEIHLRNKNTECRLFRTSGKFHRIRVSAAIPEAGGPKPFSVHQITFEFLIRKLFLSSEKIIISFPPTMFCLEERNIFSKK